MNTSGTLLRDWLVLVICAMVCVACGAAQAGRPVEAAPREKGGHLLLVGGGEKPAPVMRHFVRLAGGSTGTIVVMPLASGDSRDAGGYYVDLLRSHGAGDVHVIHVDDRRDAQRADYVQMVRSADGVWFSGGDQKRIVARLVGTPLLAALREMKDKGGVVGGTSAGTACQSDIILPGDAGDEDVIRSNNIPVARGLGLLPYAVVDQHFVARSRHNRLLSAVLEHPDHVGIGVDEATAIWVKPDGTLSVLGEGWVLIYDATKAEVGDVEGRLSARGMSMHVLVKGQGYDLRRRRVVSGQER